MFSRFKKWELPTKHLEGSFQTEKMAQAIVNNLNGISRRCKRAIKGHLCGLEGKLQRELAVAVFDYNEGLSHTLSGVKHINDLLNDFYNLIDADKNKKEQETNGSFGHFAYTWFDEDQWEF